MIRNKELFQRDPTTSKLLNDGVAAVKDAVTEQERETLRYELSHFVCEGQYKDGIVRILESYVGSINSASQLAAWISGFYGSGKSHLEKNAAASVGGHTVRRHWARQRAGLRICRLK